MPQTNDIPYSKYRVEWIDCVSDSGWATDKEFDKMILKESENLDMWTLNSVIGYEQNRAISYPANYFHSKYPNKSWKEGREVFVMFYKIK